MALRTQLHEFNFRFQMSTRDLGDFNRLNLDQVLYAMIASHGELILTTQWLELRENRHLAGQDPVCWHFPKSENVYPEVVIFAGKIYDSIQDERYIFYHPKTVKQWCEILEITHKDMQ